MALMSFAIGTLYKLLGSWDTVPPSTLYSSQFNNKNVKRSRGGLVFKAHRLLYHSTLGLRVIKSVWRSRSAPSTSSSAAGTRSVYEP